MPTKGEESVAGQHMDWERHMYLSRLSGKGHTREKIQTGEVDSGKISVWLG